MDVRGQSDERFGPVRERFAEVVRGQAGTGAALAAWCDGRLVVDLWGGWAGAGAFDGEVVNGAAWRAAEIPAINGHGTARAVAGFYQALSAHALLGPGCWPKR